MLVSTRRCTCWISSKVTFLASSLPSGSLPFPRSSTVAVPPASFLAPTDALFRVRAVAPRLEAACAAAELAELRPPGVGRSIGAAFSVVDAGTRRNICELPTRNRGENPLASRSVSNPATSSWLSSENWEEVRRNVSKGRVDGVDVPPRI